MVTLTASSSSARVDVSFLFPEQASRLVVYTTPQLRGRGDLPQHLGNNPRHRQPLCPSRLQIKHDEIPIFNLRLPNNQKLNIEAAHRRYASQPRFHLGKSPFQTRHARAIGTRRLNRSAEAFRLTPRAHQPRLLREPSSPATRCGRPPRAGETSPYGWRMAASFRVPFRA